MPKYTKAFTLVELMIVIAIIGILAAALFPRFSEYQDRSVFVGHLKNMSTMKSSIEIYYNDHGHYPIITLGGWANPYGCYGSASGQYTTNNWIPGLVDGGYIPKLPDPQTGDIACDGGNYYIYFSPTPGSEYKLLSHGQRMAKFAKKQRPELIDPRRDGGVNAAVIELDETYTPWAWGYWTPGAGW